MIGMDFEISTPSIIQLSDTLMVRSKLNVSNQSSEPVIKEEKLGDGLGRL